MIMIRFLLLLFPLSLFLSNCQFQSTRYHLFSEDQLLKDCASQLSLDVKPETPSELKVISLTKPEATFCQARYLFLTKQFNQLRQLLTTFCANQNISNKVLLDFYNKLYHTDQLELAYYYLESMITNKRQPENIYFLMARHMINDGNYIKAIELLDQVLAINPRNNEALYDSASIYFMFNDHQRVVEYLSQLADIQKLSPDQNVILATSLNKLGHLNQALEVLEKIPNNQLNEELIIIYGQLLLLKNWQNDPTRLLKYLPTKRHPTVLRTWYQDTSPEERKGTSTEFRLFY